MKIGSSTCGNKICKELFAEYAENGITHAEIALRGADAYRDFDFEGTARTAAECGVLLWSVHLPFYPLLECNISIAESREAALSLFEELIKRASGVGVGLFVVHPSGEPIAKEKRGLRMETAKRSLAELAEIAAGCSSTVAVENLPRSCLGKSIAEMKELLSVDERLRVCFDTNHLIGEDACDFIAELGDRIVTLHVSDCDLVKECHLLPGEGKIDWHRLYRALTECGYRGPWLYETSLGSTREKAGRRSLTCRDIAENAKEIFEGRELTRIPSELCFAKKG